MHRRRFLQGCAAAGVLSLGLPRSARGAGLPASELQAILDRSVSDTGLPGVVLCIDAPQGVFLGAAGKADLATGRAMTTADQFRLASVTKMLTATLILRLCKNGVLSLYGTLGYWLPDCVPNAGSIAIAQLLNHTAGVYDHENDPGLDILSEANFTKDWTEDEILAFPRAHGPDFSPGTQWRYSNTGYYLLGMVAEKATGTTVEALINWHQLGPRGLSRMSLTRRGALSAPCTGGYCLTPDNEFREMTDWNMSWDWTAGSGVASMVDLLAWGKALFEGYFLPADWLENMCRLTGPGAEITPDVGYGFGVEVWKRDKFFRERCYSHGGANGGTRTYLLHYPRMSLTICAAANRMDYSPSGIDATAQLEAVLHAVARLLDTSPAAMPAALLPLSS